MLGMFENVQNGEYSAWRRRLLVPSEPILQKKHYSAPFLNIVLSIPSIVKHFFHVWLCEDDIARWCWHYQFILHPCLDTSHHSQV